MDREDKMQSYRARAEPRDGPGAIAPHEWCPPGWVKACSGLVCGTDAVLSRIEARDIDLFLPPRTMHALMRLGTAAGEARLWVAGECHRFEAIAGALILLPAQLPVHVQIDGCVAVCQLAFTPGRLTASSRAITHPPLILGEPDPVLGQLMAALEAVPPERGTALNDLVAGVLQAIAAHLERRLAPRRRGGKAISEAVLLRLEQQIEAHSGHLDAAAAAALTSLSRSRFERELKAHTGQTWARFVLESRLRLAHRGLAEGHAAVHEVARRYGFSSLSHFSRVFSRRFGVPPSKLGR